MGPNVHFLAVASRGQWSTAAASPAGRRMRRVVLRPLREPCPSGRACGRGRRLCPRCERRLGSCVETRPRTLPLSVLALTFTTGIVDAVSHLGLGHVFPRLQTGNVVVLGFAVTGTEGFTVAPPAVCLGSFLRRCAAGRQVGGTFQWPPSPLGSRSRSRSKRCSWRSPRSPPPGCRSTRRPDRRLRVIALLAAAMGLW